MDHGIPSHHTIPIMIDELIDGRNMQKAYVGTEGYFKFSPYKVES